MREGVALHRKIIGIPAGSRVTYVAITYRYQVAALPPLRQEEGGKGQTEAVSEAGRGRFGDSRVDKSASFLPLSSGSKGFPNTALPFSSTRGTFPAVRSFVSRTSQSRALGHLIQIQPFRSAISFEQKNS